MERIVLLLFLGLKQHHLNSFFRTNKTSVSDVHHFDLLLYNNPRELVVFVLNSSGDTSANKEHLLYIDIL